MWDPDTPAAVVAVATRQHGIVDSDQLHDLGLARSTVLNWVRAGRLFRLYRGVYAVVPPALLSDEGWWLAAVRACGPGAALSHGAAAKLLGLLEAYEHPALHVSLLDRRRIKPRGVVVHRPRNLEKRDITVRCGIPTTTPTRTLFDHCSVVGPAALRAQFERAESWESLDRPRLKTLLTGATGRRGLGHLRKLSGYEPIPLARTRSKLERLVLSLCRTHSLPIPAVNVPLLNYEVDLLWPDARFVVEADGGHHKGKQRDDDNERDLALQMAGYLVRRYSWDALEDEHEVAMEILGILRRRLP